MKIVVSFVSSLAFAIPAMAIGPVVENCRTATNTEISGYAGNPVTVQVHSKSRGFRADLLDQTTGELIAKLQVRAEGARTDGSWDYNFPGDVTGKGPGFILEVYRTEESARTPTTVNANLTYWSSSGELIRADRLECEKLGL